MQKNIPNTYFLLRVYGILDTNRKIVFYKKRKGKGNELKVRKCIKNICREKSCR